MSERKKKGDRHDRANSGYSDGNNVDDCDNDNDSDSRNNNDHDSGNKYTQWRWQYLKLIIMSVIYFQPVVKE